MVPALGLPILRALGLALVFATFASINVRGVKIGTRLIEVSTIVKLLPLLALTAAGLLWVRPEHLAIEWTSPDRIGTASVDLIFAFVGIEIALAPSGEVRDPARTVPRAIFLALVITTLLYVLLHLVATPYSDRRWRRLPTRRSLKWRPASWGRPAAPWCSSAAASRCSAFLAASLLHAAQPVHLCPRWSDAGTTRAAASAVSHPVDRHHCARRHDLGARHGGSFGALVLLSNVAILVSYLLCCLAAIELQRRDVQAGGRPFRAPGGPLVPAVASLMVLWLLSHVTAQEFAVTGGAVAVAALLFGWRSLRRRAPVVAPEPVVWFLE